MPTHNSNRVSFAIYGWWCVRWGRYLLFPFPPSEDLRTRYPYIHSSASKLALCRGGTCKMFTRHSSHSEQFIPQVKLVHIHSRFQPSSYSKGNRFQSWEEESGTLTGIVRVQINHFQICTGKCLSWWVFARSWSDMLSYCCASGFATVKWVAFEFPE